MEFEVKPGKGVGDILFGAERPDVRKLLGEPEDDVKQNDESRGKMDVYTEKGIIVHYDADGTVGLVEFTGPDKPLYDGEDLLKLEDPAGWLEEQDEESDIEPPDLTSFKLGIAFYIPDSDNKSVGIFRPGYYD